MNLLYQKKQKKSASLLTLLLNHINWSFLGFHEDFTDVLAQYAYGQQLETADKENDGHKGRPARCWVTKNQGTNNNYRHQDKG